jgi:hypothetical protein
MADNRTVDCATSKTVKELPLAYHKSAIVIAHIGLSALVQSNSGNQSKAMYNKIAYRVIKRKASSTSTATDNNKRVTKNMLLTIKPLYSRCQVVS